jgi:pyruvate dehydrogenase E1 component
LAGEGLQHQDGHSHITAAFIPNCVSYDPAFAYELAVIIQDGLRRMYQEQESIFYYITTTNESYHHPAMPEGIREGILKGMYLFRQAGDGEQRVQLLGCGTILREVIAAAELLAEDFDIAADVWSVPGINLLRRDGLEVQRWNMLHPEAPPKISHLESCLSSRPGPVIAATDYLKLYADQLRPFIPGRYVVLGTDGFGRSDTRTSLRRFFEVNRYYVVIAALKALADEDRIPAAKVSKALKKYGIDPEKPNPVTV